jgi:hypothetical protein
VVEQYQISFLSGGGASSFSFALPLQRHTGVRMKGAGWGIEQGYTYALRRCGWCAPEGGLLEACTRGGGGLEHWNRVVGGCGCDVGLIGACAATVADGGLIRGGACGAGAGPVLPSSSAAHWRGTEGGGQAWGYAGRARGMRPPLLA